MAKQTTSQTHKKSPLFPFDATAGLEAWNQMAASWLEQLGSLYTELGRIEEQAAEQTRTVIDEASKVMKDSLDYTRGLHEEWRKLTLENVRRATDAVSFKS